jgi:GNAT superfamily N-acetyltransferase
MVRRWISNLRLAQPLDLEPEVPVQGESPVVASATNPFTIRRATAKDVRSLAGLWREMMEFHRTIHPAFQFGPEAQKSIERHLLDTIRSTGGRIFVADADGEIVGYTLGEIQDRKPIYPAGRYGFVSDLVVTEAWRRRGVGRLLVTTILDWFHQYGVTAIELFVLESNPVSTAFWESMGFRHYLRLLRKDLCVAEASKGDG